MHLVLRLQRFKQKKFHKMVLTLYYSITSPPARSSLLTLKVLGIPYEPKSLDLSIGEHRSEEYLKLNPQHTIPTIDDDGFVIWESHTINAYLVDKYGDNDKLYPKDLQERALVNQRLHFDNGVLFTNIGNIFKRDIIKNSTKKMTDEMRAQMDEGYDFLEKFLPGSQYAVGNDITIADFSIICSLITSNVLAPINKDKFPLVTDYMKRCELNIPYCKELNEEGIEGVKKLLKNHGFEIPSE